MRNLLLSALILASAFQTAFGATEGGWTYTVVNNKAQITSYSWSGGAVTIPSTLGGYPVGTISGQISRSIFGDSSSSITSITIPNSITTIGDYAFYGCSSLASVNIPNTVTSIGNNAFSMCTSLNSIVIPNSVITIGSSFYGCSALTSVNLGNGVTTIGDYAFQNCTAINSITIPSSVTGVGTSAFADCTSLNGVYFQGNAPNTGFGVFTRSQPTVYYLPGATGWGANFAGRPTALTGFSLSVQYDTSKGSVELLPSQALYSSGTGVTVKAIAKQGYVFGEWSGDYATISSGTILENFQVLHETTVIMNSNKTVGVTFLQDNNDSDSDGLTNFQESTVYSSNPYQADSNSDGYNDGLAVSLGYSPSINFSALISHLQSHPPTGLYTASQIQSMAIGDLVLTKNTNGSFTLNYDIEQSSDLQSWLPYQSFNLPLTNLPPDKAFIRIKVKQ